MGVNNQSDGAEGAVVDVLRHPQPARSCRRNLRRAHIPTLSESHLVGPVGGKSSLQERVNTTGNGAFCTGGAACCVSLHRQVLDFQCRLTAENTLIYARFTTSEA